MQDESPAGPEPAIAPEEPSRLWPPLAAIARGLALFLGGFSLLNILGQVFVSGFDANVWCIDLRPLPKPLARSILAVASFFLVAYAVCPRLSPWRRRLTGWVAFCLFLAAVWNVINYYVLLDRGAVRAGIPVPVSILVAAAFWIILSAVRAQQPGQAPPRRRLLMAAAFAFCTAGLPLAQMYFFGKTDYSRRADAIVVFGAGVSEEGEPSDALRDRVRTACRLYHEHLADRLVCSGGPGTGPVHETEAMRDLAIQLGVPAEAILLDTQGRSTRATVQNTTALLRRLGLRRVLAVSHFYHLPRVKMTYQRQGLEVYTVPAEESRPLRAAPYYLVREVVAIWAYYLQPLAG